MLDLHPRSPSMGRVLIILAALALAALATVPAAAAPGGQGLQRGHYIQGDSGNVTLPDLDARGNARAPTAAQKAAVPPGATVRWNRFGTPERLVRYGNYLATGLATDPVQAARQWLKANRELIRLSADAVDGLQLVAGNPIGAGRAVLFRQRFGDLASGHDGLVVVGVVEGKIAYMSSSLAGEQPLNGTPQLSAAEAFARAAAASGRQVSASDVSNVHVERGWTVMTVAGFPEAQHARLVAVPTPSDGAVPAWEVVVIDSAGDLAYSVFVDARNGRVLLRESIVDYLADNPQWRVFRAYPLLDYSSADTRELWCWTATAGCDRALENGSSPEWDTELGVPSNTTRGNNARATEDWNNASPFNVGTNFATSSPTRDYTYGWTNQWFTEKCNPDTTFTSPARNDIDAALANLTAMHNRMHDWSYKLGFTESAFNAQLDNLGNGGVGGDPEHGNGQDGGITGGPPGFAARDNANQITPQDGLTPITNMYLWQPIAAAFYSPCVDGDFDMSVIGHEYTHMISNRMVAGANQGLSGNQAGAMGESWSDLDAMEYLNEYGFVPIAGESPYAIGPYVTGDSDAGIRNYNMSTSPLNYSDVGYDYVCNVATCPVFTQVHADGEIWSATNFAIRKAMIDRYGAGTPTLQQDCADGVVAVSSCPGNRRWIQLVYDAWLLMPVGTVSMVDARDAMLAADVMRFGGANQDLLWNVFASRGLGENAASNGTNDADPIASFESPFADEATVTFKPVGDADGAAVQLFVGRYEARTNPVADTDPATPLPATFRIVPGTYEFLARGNGFGTARFTAEVKSGQVRDLPVNMPENLASSAEGATAAGDGLNVGKLIDDTEATNWASLGSPVAGKQVTVRLDPSKPWHQVARIQVSALLRTRLVADPGGDTGSQSRFSALRQFEVLTCQALADVDCSDDADFDVIFTSAPDAFPSIAPRPRTQDLLLRSFDVPKTLATYVRLRVLTNQCTGAPDFQGEQDNDPRALDDCSAGSTQDDNVRAAELQVFSK
jgi:hypothetical protein